VRRLVALVAGALATASLLALAGCGRAQGVADTRRALERAGYRDVDISLRTGGGIGIARVSAGAGGTPPPPEEAAEVAWDTLPVRFDQLVVAVGDETSSFSYDDLERRFGPRDPSLDGKQVDDEVVRSGLKLMLALTGAAILSVGVVVALGLAAVRAAKRARAA
jgi:hypothetical protein